MMETETTEMSHFFTSHEKFNISYFAGEEMEYAIVYFK
jgi:hypothetical protein